MKGDLNKHISKEQIDKAIAKKLLSVITDNNKLSFELINKLDLFDKE